MAKIKYNDYPFDEICKAVEEKAKRGVKCYQKFTCEKCGSRQTIDEANHLYTSGICEECKHVTDIKKRGCNYMAVFDVRGEDVSETIKKEFGDDPISH